MLVPPGDAGRMALGRVILCVAGLVIETKDGKVARNENENW